MEKITGMLDKISDKADFIGGALGFMNDPLQAPVDDKISWMVDRISHWKIPDPLKIFQIAMKFPEGYPWMQYAMGAGAGWVISEFGSAIDPKIGKLGRVLKKLSTGALIGNILSAFVWLPAINPHGTFTESSPVNMPKSGAYAPASRYSSQGGPGQAHSWSAPNGYSSKLRYEKVA